MSDEPGGAGEQTTSGPGGPEGPGAGRKPLVVGGAIVLALAVILGVVLLRNGGDAPGPSREKLPMLALNSINFDPAGDDAGKEWIEIFNAGGKVDVKGVQTKNAAGETIFTLPSIELPPESYLLVLLGRGDNDLNFTNNGATYFSGHTDEVLENSRDEVGLYSAGGRIIDNIPYDFTGSAKPGVPQKEAARRGIWEEGRFFNNRIFVKQDVGSIGRDLASSDTDGPADWFGDGGVDATGPTPEARNVDEEVAYALQIASAAACTPPGADPAPARELIKRVLSQIRAQHLGAFQPPDILDPGFGGWDGATFERDAGNEVGIPGSLFRLCEDLGRTEGGVNVAASTLFLDGSDTPEGTRNVLIDLQDIGPEEVAEQKLKDLLLHELVHVATQRNVRKGMWTERDGAFVPQPQQVQQQVAPCHEALAYNANLRLLQEIAPDPALSAANRDFNTRRTAYKTKHLYAEIEACRDALRNLGPGQRDAADDIAREILAEMAHITQTLASYAGRNGEAGAYTNEVAGQLTALLSPEPEPSPSPSPPGGGGAVGGGAGRGGTTARRPPPGTPPGTSPPPDADRPGPPARLILTPESDTNPLRTLHLTTARVFDADGAGLPGVIVQFRVAGVHPQSVTDRTSAGGTAVLNYLGSRAGTDTITAFADTNANGARDAGEPAATATKIWVAAAPAPGTQPGTTAPGTSPGTAGGQRFLSISDARVAEGNSGTVPMSFAVSLSAAASGPVTVQFATANGTALAGSDYQPASGTLSFSAGQTSGNIVVQVIGDLAAEGDETFFVNLSAPSGAALSDPQATGFIADDDQPAPGGGGGGGAAQPSISVNDTEGKESSDGVATEIVFTVTRSAAVSFNSSVTYTTVAGTASSPADFGAVSGVLTFGPGQTARTVTVTVVGDDIDENNETFTLQLSNPVNATIADGTGVGTIVDDDPAPTITITDVAQTEGSSEGGTTPFLFTVTLSNSSALTVTVLFATENATATSPADYASASGTLTFAPGDTEETITVNVEPDFIVEENETFHVKLSSPSNAVIGDDTGVGTIQNDDFASPVLVRG